MSLFSSAEGRAAGGVNASVWKGVDLGCALKHISQSSIAIWTVCRLKDIRKLDEGKDDERKRRRGKRKDERKSGKDEGRKKRCYKW